MAEKVSAATGRRKKLERVLEGLEAMQNVADSAESVLSSGTINVSTNWQAFPVAAVSGQTFRLTQISNDFDELRRSKGGYLQVKDFYSAAEIEGNLKFAKVRIGPEARMLN